MGRHRGRIFFFFRYDEGQPPTAGYRRDATRGVSEVVSGGEVAFGRRRSLNFAQQPLLYLLLVPLQAPTYHGIFRAIGA